MFLSVNFQFLVVKFSVYLNWHVFVVCSKADGFKWTCHAKTSLRAYADSEGQGQFMCCLISCPHSDSLDTIECFHGEKMPG